MEHEGELDLAALDEISPTARDHRNPSGKGKDGGPITRHPYRPNHWKDWIESRT